MKAYITLILILVGMAMASENFSDSLFLEIKQVKQSNLYIEQGIKQNSFGENLVNLLELKMVQGNKLSHVTELLNNMQNDLINQKASIDSEFAKVYDFQK